MKIVLIGSGNVATVMGKLMHDAGHAILQVISRNASNAQQLADLLAAGFDTAIENAQGNADIYIIATTDDNISEVTSKIKTGNKIIVHTSGAVSKDVLQHASVNYGVLYPLQSLRKEITYMPEIPLLIDANNPETLSAIQLLATSISTKVIVAVDEQRLKLHVAAVIASNFSNHLYTLTEDYCRKENVPFDMLVPLIKETANRLDEYAPKDVQTGPAARGDNATIQKHLQMLDAFPQLKDLYKIFSGSIGGLQNGK